MQVRVGVTDDDDDVKEEEEKEVMVRKPLKLFGPLSLCRHLMACTAWLRILRRVTTRTEMATVQHISSLIAPRW